MEPDEREPTQGQGEPEGAAEPTPPQGAPAPAPEPAPRNGAEPIPVRESAVPPPPEPPRKLTYLEDLRERARDAGPGERLEDKPNNPIFYIGRWGKLGEGRPNWCCRLCNFASLNGPDLVVEHFQARHVEQEEEPEPSRLVGSDGRPLRMRR